MRLFYMIRRSIIPWRDHRELQCLGFLITVFMLLSPPISSAYQVELSWEASISIVDGYRVFIREEWDTYNYGSPEWEGSNTTCAIDGLAEGTDYFFVVRAFNEYGESEDSNEVRTSTISSLVRINGSIRYEGSPLCAVLHANGQHLFTCGENLGLYDLEVPLDENGEITLYAFCSGLAPFEAVLAPEQALDFDIAMSAAPVGSPEMTLTVQSDLGTTNPDWVRITGTVAFEGTLLCAMILANGQNMFSCGSDFGTFDLEVPLDGNGEITFYAFCAGFAPYREVIVP